MRTSFSLLHVFYDHADGDVFAANIPSSKTVFYVSKEKILHFQYLTTSGGYTMSPFEG